MDPQEWAQAEWAQAGWAQIPLGSQSQVTHSIPPIQYYHLPTQFQQDHTWGQQTSFLDLSTSSGHTLDPPLSVLYVYTMEDLDNPPNPKIILEAMRQIWIQRDSDGEGRCEDCNRMGMDNLEWSRLCPICWRSLPATASPTQIPDRDTSRIISSDPRENMKLAKKNMGEQENERKIVLWISPMRTIGPASNGFCERVLEMLASSASAGSVATNSTRRSSSTRLGTSHKAMGPSFTGLRH